jgi:DNA-binding response OmpR family regulator
MPRPVGNAILVVDDQDDIRESVADFLQLEGYPGVGAANGAAALAEIERALPRVILLDMCMPVMDGWAFARALRERGLRVPVMVLTAAPNARRWAREIEADDYLPKPFDLDDLLRKVRTFYPRPSPPS